MKPWSSAVLVAVAMLVVGCGSDAASIGPASGTDSSANEAAPPGVDPATVDKACQFGAVVFDVGPVALCTRAVALATARLGILRWPITSIAFRLSVCPPNARCLAAVGEPVEGWVIFTFSAGAPAIVHVGRPSNVGAVPNALIAGPPQPVPDWLLKEIAASRD
jgi:hypothetical protein